jgi:hypothetical protein
MQRVSSLAPGSGLGSGTLCQAVNRGGAAPAGSRGRCDENSPHCYGGRQEEKPHEGATNFAVMRAMSLARREKVASDEFGQAATGDTRDEK